MFFYVYVLHSHEDGSLYKGFTEHSLKDRIKEHKKCYVDSTKHKRPLELVYFEGHKDKSVAREREQYLKSGWGRRYLHKILDDYINSPKT